ncbi:MAG: hypothetical protein HC852_22830 [Acaryochloridaceae cyanobacterium RU_4_10]|nr:hypothetical protein [Acaryochloridaceae cyanobacterium RU_4_10]
MASFILFSYVIAFISRLFKENNIFKFFIALNILSLGIYIFYRIIRFFVEEKFKSKERTPLIKSLEKSTLNYEMTDLEKSYFPNLHPEEIKTIIEHLSLCELFSLQIVELYLNRFNKIAEKNFMYFQRFYTFGIGFIVSFVAFSDFKFFLINGIISAFVLLEVYLEKYGVFGKIALSLHVLKEAQFIKAKREEL